MRAPFTASMIAGPQKNPPCGPGARGLAGGPVDAACPWAITYSPLERIPQQQRDQPSSQ